MEAGSAGGGHDDRVAAELARLRETLDDLRRRPIPPDADTLRHVVTASLSEAAAPPPNLLVTAIRRLDRLDARLESIEAALGGPAPLPRGQATARGRTPVAAAAAPLGPAPQAADPEAIADALARRLAGMIGPRAAVAPAPSPAARIEDLVAALRPLVPEAARSVLRRAGREPSPQAVEVLQQTALSAIEEAARSLHVGGFSDDPWAPDPRPLGPPPEVRALAPPGPSPAVPPAPSPPPPPPPLDVDQLAATIATQVAASVTAQLRPPEPVDEPRVRPAEPPQQPPLDPKVVAEAVISRLAEQPPPQAVVSPMAMAPLLSAVGNVEAAVARIVEPDAEVVTAVDRLEAGVEALARALEDDRSLQADEVRRGFAELHDLLRTATPLPAGATPAWAADEDERSTALDEAGSDAATGAHRDDARAAAAAAAAAGGRGIERIAAAVAGLQRRLDQLCTQLEPLADADLAVAVPEVTMQGQRLERSLNHILTALAALAEHLHEQSATWRGRFDDLDGLVSGTGRPEAGGQTGPVPGDVGDLRGRIDELVSGLAADRQRYQRLGGTIDGLAELLGQVSSRLDRLPRSVAADLPVEHESAPASPGLDLASGAGGLDLASGAGGLNLASGAGGLDLASGAGGLDPPEAALFAVAEPFPPSAVDDDEAPAPVPPQEQAATAAPAPTSPWYEQDDEPWTRDDPWAGAEDQAASESPEATGSGAGRHPSGGESEGSNRSADPSGGETSNSSTAHVEPGDDAGQREGQPAHGALGPDQGRRRRRNRRGRRD